MKEKLKYIVSVGGQGTVDGWENVVRTRQLLIAEGQDQVQVPVVDTARSLATAPSVGFRHNPNRSDKIQNHRSKHWLPSAVGTGTFV